jgi:putative transposase
MSRVPRIVIPNYPHHVVHRGHNRQAVFHAPGDHEAYLANLQEFKAEFRVRVNAFCLMPNHVHLLLVPEDAGGLGSLMKRLAGRHAARWNRRYKRTGAVWEGRFYSSLVARDSYHLACCRYIELNPVRAGLARDPVEYPWSSCAYRVDGTPATCLDLDALYLALGSSPSDRWEAYRAYMAQGVTEAECQLIKNAVSRSQLTGDEAFSTEVAAVTGRLVKARGRGRPPKEK